MNSVDGTSISSARAILTRAVDFLGPQEIEEVCGLTLPKVPIRWSEKQIKLAHNQDQHLILHPKDLTMKRIWELRNGQTRDGKPLLDERDLRWYENEEFFTTETMRPGWRMTSLGLLPSFVTGKKNYFEQTEELLKALIAEKPDRFADPRTVDAASEEFLCNEAYFRVLIVKDLNRKAAGELAALKANQEFRERPVEVLWSLMLYEGWNGERLLPEGRWNATNKAISGGWIVHMGSFGKNGIRLDKCLPSYRQNSYGVRLSRAYQ